MKNFSRNNDRGGDWKRGPSKFGSHAGPRPDRPMFKATCDSCQQTCMVPFKPNGSKPVFCRECFKKDENAPSYAPARERSFDRPSFDRPAPSAGNAKMEAQLSRIEEKLDELLEALSEAGEGEDEEETEA